MNVIFLSEAEDELVEATLYYENQALGLGEKFYEDAYKAVDSIVEFPLINQKLTDKIRRKLFKNYPFALLYQIDDKPRPF